MRLFCREDHSKPYVPDYIDKDLRNRIDWFLRSNAAVQVGFDEHAMRDYPLLVDNLVELFRQELKEQENHD